MSIIAAPLAEVAASVRELTVAGRWKQSVRYLLTSEAHTYAFAIAANVLLSFLPFAVLLLSVCKNVLRSTVAYDAVLAVLSDALPANQEFILRNVQVMVRSTKVSLISLALLLFTSKAALMPLEVALNRIWGIPQDRSFWMNKVVSFGLTFLVGALAFVSILLTGMHRAAIGKVFGAGMVTASLSWAAMKVVALPVTILTFFVLYYFLPNGKVPARPMLRAAILAGCATEAAKYLYIWSLPWLNFQGVYGPFSVSVTLIFWAYLGSLIMLAGAHASAMRTME
jgi:YihY family inner membrane protein